ncbi:MAG TPA: prepilin-type N-terminal cleavage/methylation domain-containing protein [Verrucomicrobiae bacterium]|nr:prepilin-type N-terminal cleavage/methylation domain-containing protein [Verrucomicrobiae bacterium]
MQEPRQLHCRLCASAAFSLIELLVVVAVFLLLTTLYWSHGPSKRDTDLTACRQHLEKIYLAMEIYARDYAAKYPVATNALDSEDALVLLVPRYTSDTSDFLCPASGDTPLPAGKSFRDWKISYAYYMGRRSADVDTTLMSDAQVNSFSKNTGDTVFSSNGKPPGNNHGKGGGNFLTCGGAVVSSGDNAPFSLELRPPIVLLNPKP